MWGIYSALQAAFNRKRKCQNCGKINIVKYEDKLKTIKCSNCGHSIPSPKGQL